MSTSCSFRGGYPRWVAFALAVLAILVTCGLVAVTFSAGLAAIAIVPTAFGAVLVRRFVWTFLYARVTFDAGWATVCNLKSTVRIRLDGAGVFVSPYGPLLPRFTRNFGRAGFIDQDGRVFLCSGVGAGHFVWRRQSAGWDMLAAAVASGAREVESPYWLPFVGWRLAD